MPLKHAYAPRPTVSLLAFNTTSNVFSGTLNDVVLSPASRVGTIYVDGIPVGTVTTASDGTWGYKTPLNAGTHSFQAQFGSSLSPLINQAINAAGPFFGPKGINVTVLGFAQGTRNRYTTADIDLLLTPTWAARRLAQGDNYVRLCVDPGPMMSSIAAAGGATGASYAADKAVWVYALNKLLNYGFRVDVDNHVSNGSGETTYTCTTIQNDYATSVAGGGTGTVASGNKWSIYLAMVADMAATLATYPAGQVAYELWNEATVSVGQNWPARVQTIWAAARGAAATLFLLVSGTHYAGVDGLQELTASNFDALTGFVFHSYDPQQITYQGLTSGPVPHTSRMPFPYCRSDALAAYATLATATGLAINSVSIAGTTATVTTASAHGLTGGSSGSFVAIFGGSTNPTTPAVITVTSTTTFTVAVPSGYTWSSGTFTTYYPEVQYHVAEFALGPIGYDRNSLQTYTYNLVETWRLAQNPVIPASRIFQTEFGCKRDIKQNVADNNGASLLAAAKNLQDHTFINQSLGYNQSLWTDDITTNNVFDIRVTCAGPYMEPAIAAATGRAVLAKFFEKEASDFLDRLTSTISNKRASHINAVFRLLKDLGAISLIDGMWCLSMVNVGAGYSIADAKQNFFPKPAVYTSSFVANPSLTEFGAGTWTDGGGYASDGTTGYLDTGISPGISAGSVVTQNNAGLLLHQNGLNTVDSQAWGFGNSNLHICAKTGAIYGGVFRSVGVGTNGCTLPYTDEVIAIARFDSVGDYVYTRGSVAFSGATQVAESAKVSSAPTSGNVAFGRASAGNFAKPSCMFRSGMIIGGAGLTSHAQVRDLSTVLDFAHLGWSFML